MGVQPIVENARGISTTNDGSIRITGDANVELAGLVLRVARTSGVELEANLVHSGDKSEVTLARIGSDVNRGARILGISSESVVSEVDVARDELVGITSIADTPVESIGGRACGAVQVQIDSLRPLVNDTSVTVLRNDDSKNRSIPVVVDAVVIVVSTLRKGDPRRVRSPLVECTRRLIRLILRYQEVVVEGLDGSLTDNSSRRPPGDISLEGADLKNVVARGQAVRSGHVVVEGSELNTVLSRSKGVPEPRVVVRITRTVATHHIVNLGGPDGTLEGGGQGLGAGIGGDGSGGGAAALIHKEISQQAGLVISSQDTSVREVNDGVGRLGGVPERKVVDETIEALADGSITISATEGTNVYRVGQGGEGAVTSAVVMDHTITAGINDNHNSVPLTVDIVGDGTGDYGSARTVEDVAGSATIPLDVQNGGIITTNPEQLLSRVKVAGQVINLEGSSTTNSSNSGDLNGSLLQTEWSTIDGTIRSGIRLLSVDND